MALAVADQRLTGSIFPLDFNPNKPLVKCYAHACACASDEIDCQLLPDCVEKVDSSRSPAYWLLKTPFLRAATRNLSSESSAQSKDFNLKRVLFCRGNHGRLFQQNRPFSVDHGYNTCWSNPMQSLVRTNASDWSGRMQTGGKVERNFAPSVRPTATLPPNLCIKDSCFPGAYIRSPARTHSNQTLTPKALSKMRYIAIIFATLALALYSWYRHLRDDEDDLF